MNKTGVLFKKEYACFIEIHNKYKYSFIESGCITKISLAKVNKKNAYLCNFSNECYYQKTVNYEEQNCLVLK